MYKLQTSVLYYLHLGSHVFSSYICDVLTFPSPLPFNKVSRFSFLKVSMTDVPEKKCIIAITSMMWFLMLKFCVFQQIMKAECVDTKSKSMSMLTLDQLCTLLVYAIQRMKKSGVSRTIIINQYKRGILFRSF